MKRYMGFLGTLAVGLLVLSYPRSASSHETVTTTVLFDREIVRILNKHCIGCHVEGGSAFPIVTYEQTYNLRRQIRMDSLDGKMAPWAGVPGYGHFANDNQLTRREVDFIVSWAEGWGPRNAGGVYSEVSEGQAPPKAVEAHKDFTKWDLGKPDALLDLAPSTVDAGAKDVVKRVVVDPKITADKWLSGVAYQPGDRRVVHAVYFSVEKTGEWIGSWTPWYEYAKLPDGLAYKLAAGTKIVAEIHYSGAKEAVTEHGTLGLYFADKASVEPISDVVVDAVARPDGVAYAGVKKLDTDMNILSLRPEVGRGVQSVEVAARTPDGVTRVLLFAKDFTVAWPTAYLLESPVALPKGTELLLTEYYEKGVQPAGPLTISVAAGGALQAKVENPAPAAKHYPLSAVVKAVDPKQRVLLLQHTAIPGLMGAMTMSYDAGEGEDLTKVAVGDHITADLVVMGEDSMHIEKIVVTGK